MTLIRWKVFITNEENITIYRNNKEPLFRRQVDFSKIEKYLESKR